MQKHQISLIFLSIYELARACLLLGIPAFLGGFKSGAELPASFYYSAPLLILPFIIVVAEIFGLEKLASNKYLFILIKLLNVVSYIGFFTLNFREAVQQFRFSNYKPFYSLILLMIFFLIDVIIALIAYNNEKAKQIKKDE